jgi:hypothetical protein
MKGLTPGTGIGCGHRPDWYRRTQAGCDKDGRLLRQWVGEDDAELYFALNLEAVGRDKRVAIS